jgi:DNA-binding NtrC family response regulator
MANTPTALIIHRRGRPSGLAMLDATASWTIGRGAGVDVCCDDDGVSRLHAHLKHDGGAYLLVDAHSANGTFVAAADVRSDAGALSDDAARRALFAHARLLLPGQPHTLAVGDVVFLGDAHAALEAIDDGASTSSMRSTPTASSASSSMVSEAGLRFERALQRAGRGRGPVLLMGPSGSGKTWAARRIHDESHRRGRFIALNAAALPHDPVPLRSVLLGHKKGAFTGATSDVEGAWTAADGGTLFLDEIDSLHPEGQAFLLTLLEQSGDLGALGAAAGAREVMRDVFVVAASKTSLQQARLRADLAWRLVDGVIVEVPDLAARRDDIPALVRQLVADLRREDGVSATFSDDAIAAAAAASWPGQVRQLRGVVRMLAREAIAEGRQVVSGDDVRARLVEVARALGDVGPATTPPSAPGSPPAADHRPPLRKKARALTADDVREALRIEGGNIARAAERLDVARNTLIGKMDGFGITRPGRSVDD